MDATVTVCEWVGNPGMRALAKAEHSAALVAEVVD